MLGLRIQHYWGTGARVERSTKCGVYSGCLWQWQWLDVAVVGCGSGDWF